MRAAWHATRGMANLSLNAAVKANAARYIQRSVRKKLTHFNEGGDAGNRETKINALIKRMA